MRFRFRTTRLIDLGQLGLDLGQLFLGLEQ